MGKRAEPGQVVVYEDEIMEVVAIGEGRTVTLRPVIGATCPSCGSRSDVHLLEHSPLFQQHVHPVKTIEGDP